jgi:hypothetical protein
MATSWFYASGGARKGPVALDDLQDALQQGEIDRESLVWCKGMAQWQALESVPDLRSLLEQLPPQLPPAPPPLPVEGSPRDNEGPTRRRRSGKTTQRAAGTLASALWEWFLAHWVYHCILACVVVGSVSYIIVIRESDNDSEEPPPPLVASGVVRIDANPWGRIEWIRSTDGTEVPLPSNPTTPFLLSLPEGSYEALVTYPHNRASKRCPLQVEADQMATCWLDLAPVNAAKYFETLGW